MSNRGLRSLLTVLSLLLLFSVSMAQPDPDKLFGQGFDMMMERKYEKALPVWERLLEERPDDPHVHFYVGACLHRTPDRRLEGIPHLEKAVEHTVPSNEYRPKLKLDNVPMTAHYLLADLYHLDYRFKKAIDHYNEYRSNELEEQVKEMPVPVERKVSMCQSGLKLKKDPRKVRIENLGERVNSKYKEHSPVANLDETVLYFTSRRLRKDSSNVDMVDPETGQYKEDIYVSYKENGEWQEAEMLDLNSDEHEATINLSKDARRLFIYKDIEGVGNIYESKRTDNGLGEPQKMGEHVNSEAYETHLDVSADNDRLYFSSDREGGEGGRDLYMVKKLPTGDWAQPQNLGPTINTEYDEDGPFIHPDGKTLYFSSQGHNTMGGYDVFKTQQDENGNWKEPVNVGYPINSPDDDIYFVTTPDGKRAYYSSDFKGLETEQTGKIEGQGSSDIYLLQFPEAEEKKLTLLKGVIEPGNCEDILSEIMVMVRKKQSQELVQQLNPRDRDGVYVSTLLPGKTYTLTYLKGNEVFHTEELTVEEGSAYQEIRRAINLDTLNFDCSRGELALAQEGDGTEGSDEKEGQEGSSKEEEGEMDQGDGKGSETGASGEGAAGELPAAGSYQRHFGYNENEMTTRDKEFTSFVEDLIRRIKASDEKVGLRIEASASRVPTSTFNNNQELAELRAKNAMKKLRRQLNEAVPRDAYEFVEVEQLIQGPEYEGDASEGKEKYGEHQYVKIEVLD